MDLELSAEQRAVVETTRAFAHRELMPYEDEVERSGRLDSVRCGHGGVGLVHLTFAEAMRRIATGGFPTVAALYASEDQHEGARAFAENRPPVWKGH